MLPRWGWVHGLVGIVVLGRRGAHFGVQESMHWPSRERVEACAVLTVVSHMPWACGSQASTETSPLCHSFNHARCHRMLACRRRCRLLEMPPLCTR